MNDGLLVSAAMTSRDITASASRLAAIVESSDDAIISTDLDGTVTSWNRASERLYGFTEAEMVGRSIVTILPDERKHEEDVVHEKIRQGLAVEHFETVRRHKDGSLVDVSLTVSPIRDESGNVIGASKIARDISDRKRGQRYAAVLAEIGAVLASSLEYQETLTTIANLAVPDIADSCGVDLVNDEGRIERLAAAHVEPAKLALVQTIRDRYEDPSSPYSIAAVVRTGNPVLIPTLSDEMIVAAARGDQERIRLVRALALRSYICVPLIARGRTLGALCFATSESGRHYNEDDLRFAQDVGLRAALAVDNARAYAQLQIANRVKDDFLATLSHELRTPLNAILGYARMLRSGWVTGEKHARAVEAVERNATALTQIVEDVLDVSRIVAGKIRLNIQPLDLPVVVRNAVDTILPAAEAKGVRVKTILDPGAAPVSGDPDRIQQIVWNLAANAVKFTPRGGMVQVVLQRVNSHVEIAVSDTGVGIRPDFLPHIFERFRQADSGSTRATGGLGLGLAIARHLVEAHGGTIHAASPGEGAGATFRVRLPLMIVHAEPLERRVHPRTQTAPPATALPDLHTVRVLVVDDEPDATALVREILEAAGADVATADSAVSALDRIAGYRPDVLITDLGMPVMDGFELISRIRALPDRALSEVPAAALTAYARSEDRIKALDRGFQLHLAKPVDPTELVVAIASLVRRTRL